MTPQEFDTYLQQTFADQHLSRNEKQLLKEILDEDNPDDQKRALLRQQAFALAHDSLLGPEAKRVLTWLEAVVKVLHPAQPQTAPPGVADVWFAPDQDCPQKINQLIHAAKHSIDICVFTITDNRVAHPIIDAHKKGINIRVITDNEKLHDLGADIKKFAEAGIPIRVDLTDDHMHHKFALFDNELLLTGSYNWTRSAAEHNLDNFIVTNHANLLARFSKEFERLWRQLKTYP